MRLPRWWPWASKRRVSEVWAEVRPEIARLERERDAAFAVLDSQRSLDLGEWPIHEGMSRSALVEENRRMRVLWTEGHVRSGRELSEARAKAARLEAELNDAHDRGFRRGLRERQETD